ncbi:hypothetical protein RU87_GL000145 [Lactococcus plantarum]|uniref:Uncharacterized protein n=1 Tax=Pseudolactococcus plantarum TaxID=1365 RepID=A0A2A5S4F3_9LACT|nr:hypothetical protein RU87_GL000145 [Lactococcus plantarum]
MIKLKDKVDSVLLINLILTSRQSGVKNQIRSPKFFCFYILNYLDQVI